MMLSIGDLSDQTGVSTQTIRYYERIHLLPEPKRANNGYRIYNEIDVERLQFIQRARALDFSLDDVGEILAFRERNEPPCQYVMGVMKTQIDEILARIHDLERLRDELSNLYQAGKELPDDVQMRTCVCHLIKVGTSER
ncbi:MAG: heavy metal-responsive transcriptional regulator [Anaerolineae bacterium]|nr:heavy metal-responsive transcriptional regulator [Anaerolineae bacterium]